MSKKLKELLKQKINKEFARTLLETEKKVPKYIQYLKKVYRKEDWTIPITIEGEDIKDPSLTYFDMLEHIGLLSSKDQYTHRNSYKVYKLSKNGKKLIEKILSEKS
jgi:hypothetical protein